MRSEILSKSALVIGSGAAGLAAAARLAALGVRDLALYTEGLGRGTSINAGSDKQTYYKLGMDGAAPDSPVLMAQDLAAGGAVHGDLALVEASLSPLCFSWLVSLGVAFPFDRYGRPTGYRTDHDARSRATSAGPYTSRDMCRALQAEVARRGVEVVERRVCQELLVRDGAAVGAVFATEDGSGLEAVVAENVVFATGGPGGLYGRSVYPLGHTGGIGVALQAGADARNLAEFQFGMASTKFRWNVSGSYMQVVPRLFSVDDAGVEREFASDALGVDEALRLLFLKGYQWPFAAANARGSSLIDILVYRETVLRGRRVFLDYRRNPSGFDLASLSREALDYLQKSGAALPGSPFERLRAMNPAAIDLYRDHAIDLAAEPLEIAVCAQHNNGGLAADLWWESENVRHLFPIAEVNGSHVVVRPGGSALNAGQVGAWRAAERIAAGHANPAATSADGLAREALARYAALLARPAPEDWRAARARIQARMDRAGGFLRDRAALAVAIDEARDELSGILTAGAGGSVEALRNRQIAFASLAYLQAMAGQLERAGSRGGALALDPSGDPLSSALGPEWRAFPEKTEARGEVAVSRFAPGGAITTRYEPCRPVPTELGWFEEVWREFRNRAPAGGPA